MHILQLSHPKVVILKCEVNYKKTQSNYKVFSARKVSPYTANDIK